MRDAVFTCEVLGCAQGARVGGKCVEHYIRNKQGHLPETDADENEDYKRCGKNKGKRSGRKNAGKPSIKKSSDPVPTMEASVETDTKKILIAVDFTAFPKVYENLLKQAALDSRTPAEQMLYYVHNELSMLEERAV